MVFPDFRCVHGGTESWASRGWSLSAVFQSQTFQDWWGVIVETEPSRLRKTQKNQNRWRRQWMFSRRGRLWIRFFWQKLFLNAALEGLLLLKEWAIASDVLELPANQAVGRVHSKNNTLTPYSTPLISTHQTRNEHRILQLWVFLVLEAPNLNGSPDLTVHPSLVWKWRTRKGHGSPGRNFKKAHRQLQCWRRRLARAQFRADTQIVFFVNYQTQHQANFCASTSECDSDDFDNGVLMDGNDQRDRLPKSVATITAQRRFFGPSQSWQSRWQDSWWECSQDSWDQAGITTQGEIANEQNSAKSKPLRGLRLMKRKDEPEAMKEDGSNEENPGETAWRNPTQSASSEQERNQGLSSSSSSGNPVCVETLKPELIARRDPHQLQHVEEIHRLNDERPNHPKRVLNILERYQQFWQCSREMQFGVGSWTILCGPYFGWMKKVNIQDNSGEPSDSQNTDDHWNCASQTSRCH